MGENRVILVAAKWRRGKYPPLFMADTAERNNWVLSNKKRIPQILVENQNSDWTGRLVEWLAPVVA